MSALDETKTSGSAHSTRHDGCTMNRVEVLIDGKTAYQRCQGKKTRCLGLEFVDNSLMMEKISTVWEVLFVHWNVSEEQGADHR